MVALVWPAPTAFVLVIVVAAWALVGGVAEFFAGFQTGETAGTRALFILSGLVSVAFTGARAVTCEPRYRVECYYCVCGTTRPVLVRTRAAATPNTKPPTCAKKATPPPSWA